MAKGARYRISGTDAGHLWFCLALPEGWTACYRLIPGGGRPVVAELRVVPTPPEAVVNIRPDGEPQGHHEPPGDGLTATTLKDRVVMGEHVYNVLPKALRNSRRSLGPLFEATVGALGFQPESKPRRNRRGPKGWPDIDYARLAADYLDACNGTSRSPVADLAADRTMTPGALRAALHRARKRGLLTRQTAGRAGGELTPRAKKLLREQGRH